MLNIIMSENGSLRAPNFNANTKYDIAEINFYIQNSLAKDSQCFLIIKNKQGVLEIIELIQAGSQNGNTLYKLPLNQKIRIHNDTVKISYIIFNNNSNNYILSSSIEMNIIVEKYELARQVYIAHQINIDTANLYAKMVNLAQNVENIYEKIKEERG